MPYAACLGPDTTYRHMRKIDFNQRAIVKDGKISIVLKTVIAPIVAALVLGSATNCFAHSGTQDEQQACTPDVFRLCSAQIPNEDRIVACLNKHLAKLNPACRAVMTGAPLPKSKEKR